MADVSITAANVARVSGTAIRDYNAGETITAGMVVYLKSTDSKWYKAQCDGTAEEAGGSVRMGIALHGSLAGQPLAVQVDGTVTIGGTVVTGTPYVVSAAAGGIAPFADLVSTNKVSYIGWASSTTVLTIAPNATGVAIA